MCFFKNWNIFVEIFVGYINKNEVGDKGFDDLFVNFLCGKEEELVVDIEFVCNEKKGLGKYIEMFKVIIWIDYKL